MTDLAQNHSSGKIIFVNGAPYSGKTYLVAQLADKIGECKIVNYELFYGNGGYMGFYTEVIRLSDLGHTVIAESVNSRIGYNKSDCPSLNRLDCLNIAVSPSLVMHEKNKDRFISLFGSKANRNRIGGFSLKKLRQSVKLPKSKYCIYNHSNLDEIKELVYSYVIYN